MVLGPAPKASQMQHDKKHLSRLMPLILALGRLRLRMVWVQNQPVLDSEFQNHHSYRVRYYQKKNTSQLPNNNRICLAKLIY